jgi:ATP-dependent DNA helicase RecG
MGRSLVFLARTDILALKKCSKSVAKSLKSLNINNLADLLTYYPRRYVDMSNELLIKQAKINEDVLITGVVRNIVGPRQTRSKKSLVEVLIQDLSGYMILTFFNQPWRVKQLELDMEVAVFGKISIYKGYKSMTNPTLEVIGKATDSFAGKIIPIYPSSEKLNLTSRHFRSLINEILQRSTHFIDPVPEEFLKKHNLLTRDQAIRYIHCPPTIKDVEKARKRLAFDELLRVQIPLVKRDIELKKYPSGISHVDMKPDDKDGLLWQFVKKLPFELTAEQHRVIKDILKDMASPYPMHRLLQGDVGAGKTVVAMCAIYTAVSSGYQAALMAPTEVLAEQHFSVVKNFFSDYQINDPNTLEQKRPVKVELLTSSMPTSKRKMLLKDLKVGKIDIVIGTHALISSDVEFKNLSLVVIDEQHRFGVEQRFALREKSSLVVDTLVMTATPIPRTAAMVVYGDLELSTIKALPAGRKPIKTKWVKTDLEEKEAFDLMVSEVLKGYKGYVICPMVEDSERFDASSVMSEYKRLKQGYLANVSVAVLHGQMPQKEKEDVINRFKNSDISVLISTTVVEVGVDVPDATVMIILDADRFGIAQLHQLRGRVGRSFLQSYCFLVSKEPSDDAVVRLEALENTTDGFELAEVDLSLRGEGTLMDLRQQGASDLKLASLRKDKDLVLLARQLAYEILQNKDCYDQKLINMLMDEVEVFISQEKKEFIFKS